MQRYHPSSSLSVRVGKTMSPRGQELESLVESDALRRRFFAWLGVSGRRYVCSVFQHGEEGFIADVESGVVIGVARDGVTARPVCVFAARAQQAGEAQQRRSLRQLAHELGVAEWHVHFCADAETVRDLAGSLLN
jgi:hypothetical protein